MPVKPGVVERYPTENRTAWLFKIKGWSGWVVAYRDGAGKSHLFRDLRRVGFTSPGYTTTLRGAEQPQSVLVFEQVGILAWVEGTDIDIVPSDAPPLRVASAAGRAYP